MLSDLTSLYGENDDLNTMDCQEQILTLFYTLCTQYDGGLDEARISVSWGMGLTVGVTQSSPKSSIGILYQIWISRETAQRGFRPLCL